MSETTHHYPNQYEQRARTRKALALAEVIEKLGMCRTDLALWPDDAKQLVADEAGVKFPSDATWAVVVELIRHRMESGAIEDPFADLPGVA